MRVIRAAVGLSVATLLSPFLAAEARADAMTYQYSGTIGYADPSTGVAVGTPSSGTIAIDPTDVGATNTADGWKVYDFGGTPDAYHTANAPLPQDSGLTFAVGGRTIATTASGLAVTLSDSLLANPNAPAGWVIPNSFITMGPREWSSNSVVISLTLDSPNASTLPTFDLPVPLSLGNFPLSTLSVTQGQPDGSIKLLYSAEITSLSLVPAPEPSTTALLVLGSAAWLASARRNRSA